MNAEKTQYRRQVLERRFRDVRQRIERAIEGREEKSGVEVVAVSKTHPVEAMQVLYDLGVRNFGESYVQEWREKVDLLPDDIEWHFVGRLQSNKARYVADRVAMVHSIDRKSVSRELNKRCEAPIDVLLQVNLGLQETKGGVAVEDLTDLMELVARYPRLRVRGLMGMPPYFEEAEESRPYFRRLRQALGELQNYVEREFPDRRPALTELSMGMSNDFEVAVEEGATILRLGTVLFGKRDYDE